jgi:hypothetical protein
VDVLSTVKLVNKAVKVNKQNIIKKEKRSHA